MVGWGGVGASLKGTTGQCNLLQLSQKAPDECPRECKASKGTSYNAEKVTETIRGDNTKSWQNKWNCLVTKVPVAGQWLGCWSDDAERGLKVDNGGGYGYTFQTCQFTCANYKYFALQNNGACFCGNSYAQAEPYEIIPIEDCKAPCAGDPDSSTGCGGGPCGCGGPWRNMVYRVEEAQVGQWLGCWSDDSARALKQYQGSGYNFGTCEAKCAAYNFFSLQYYGQCFCDNSYGMEDPYVMRPVEECKAPCAGDPDSSTGCGGGPCRCGGAWRNMVYKKA